MFIEKITTILFLMFFGWTLQLNGQIPTHLQPSSQTNVHTDFRNAVSLRFTKPDSSIGLLEECYQNFIQHKDTFNASLVLRELAQHFGHQAAYRKAYDKLWEALFLADQAHLDEAKIILYLDIGRYYSFYKRKERALQYFELSRSLARKLIADEELGPGVLSDVYYAYCSTFRELDQPVQATLYLDSAYAHYDKVTSSIPFANLQCEEAFLMLQNNKPDQAIKLFTKTLPWFRDNNPGYQVLVFTYMGDAYRAINQFKNSEKYYKEALTISSANKSHLDFTPLIHERLADLYYTEGDLKNAYTSLKSAKNLDEDIFDSRSTNNRPLLEILDAFRLEKEQQKKLIQEKRLEQLEHEEDVLFWQRTILLVCIIFILLFSLVYVKYIRSKHRAEKRVITRKQELELQKANEIVELKNKELSASTLKLIEKDEFISSLKHKLSTSEGEVNVREIKRIVNTMESGNKQNWEEFEARFVSVNKGFYERIHAKFPKLTQKDLKICALVKLNFNSKDMSRLLGISVESVHTTRYRLRKKLQLSRDTNLTEFISSI